MIRSKFAVGIGILIILAGCIPASLYPLYTEKDLIFDPNLLGEWTMENDDQWIFTRHDEKSYKLVYTDKEGKKGAFRVHLLKVEDRMFLDFFPDEPDGELNDFYVFHLIPAHSFARVRQIQPALEMSFGDVEKLEKLIEKNPKVIDHEQTEDRFVLTATSEELQAFLIEHEDELFDDFATLEQKVSYWHEDKDKPAAKKE